MKSAYICDAVRTPIGKHGGTLATIRPDDMAALTIAELLKRNPGINPEAIDDVILGNANQAGEDNRDVARMALLLAGLPYSVPGETVNRLCSSGMSAAIHAARAISAGDGDLFIAGGVESMTRAPFVLSKSDSAFSRNVQIYDTSIGWRFINPKMQKMYGTDSMGETAENVAEKWKISREAQDEFAYHSQMKAVNSRNNGRLAKEIMPVEIKVKKTSVMFGHDEFIRDETSVETLAKLKPAFKPDGSVTAGNSSGVNDGACSLIIASETGVYQNKLTPLARVVSSAVAGVEPRIMGIGPVPASNKALAKAGLTIDDIDVIELNEAFAAQSLACLLELGIAPDDSRLNPNGGAIALGHPLGMSGARLIATATYELIERHAKYALCTMCVGVGQGYAVIIERV